MNIANSDLKSSEETSPLIAKLRRQTAAAGNDPVPAATYEEQNAYWLVNYSTRPYGLELQHFLARALGAGPFLTHPLTPATDIRARGFRTINMR